MRLAPVMDKAPDVWLLATALPQICVTVGHVQQQRRAHPEVEIAEVEARQTPESLRLATDSRCG